MYFIIVNRKKIRWLCLFLFSSFLLELTWPLLPQSLAGEFKEWLKISSGEHYQQTEYKLVDPKGDAYLIRKLDQVPRKLLEALLRAGSNNSQHVVVSENNEDLDRLIAEQEEILRKENFFAEMALQNARTPGEIAKARLIIGRKKPINVDRLLNAFKLVIQSHPEIPPTMSPEHKWCKEAHTYLIYGFWHRMIRFLTGKQKDFPAPIFMRSKLFLCLACGWTARYMISGKEKALEARLMSYPDRGVQIHDAFRESYILNKGDIYLTFLTLENVLAGNPYVEGRENLPLQKKLAYIRNDSERTGDNYAAWYHFFGIALYALVRPGLVSRAVAEIESLGSLFLEGPDKQEDYINRLGAIFGLKLKRMLKNGTYLEPLRPDDRLDYMTLDEFPREDNANPFGK